MKKLLTFKDIQVNVVEANKNLVKANRHLLQAMNACSEHERKQEEATRKFLKTVFRTDKNVEGMSRSHANILAELKARKYPITLKTIERRTGLKRNSIYTCIYKLRKAGYKINKVTGGGNVKFQLTA